METASQRLESSPTLLSHTTSGTNNMITRQLINTTIKRITKNNRRMHPIADNIIGKTERVISILQSTLVNVMLMGIQRKVET